MLRPVLEMGSGVAQTRMRRGVLQTRIGWDAELLKLALNAGLLRPASEVSMFLGTRGPRFSRRIKIGLTSDGLSLVIFRQRTTLLLCRLFLFIYSYVFSLFSFIYLQTNCHFIIVVLLY